MNSESNNDKNGSSCETSYFIKKPIIIRAYKTKHEIKIHTPEGDMMANPGDWVITGVKEEVYPCKPDIFDLTYENISEDKKFNIDIFLTESALKKCPATLHPLFLHGNASYKYEFAKHVAIANAAKTKYEKYGVISLVSAAFTLVLSAVIFALDSSLPWLQSTAAAILSVIGGLVFLFSNFWNQFQHYKDAWLNHRFRSESIRLWIYRQVVLNANSLITGKIMEDPQTVWESDSAVNDYPSENGWTEGFIHKGKPVWFDWSIDRATLGRENSQKLITARTHSFFGYRLMNEKYSPKDSNSDELHSVFNFYRKLRIEYQQSFFLYKQKQLKHQVAQLLGSSRLAVGSATVLAVLEVVTSMLGNGSRWIGCAALVIAIIGLALRTYASTSLKLADYERYSEFEAKLSRILSEWDGCNTTDDRRLQLMIETEILCESELRGFLGSVEESEFSL